MHRSSYHDDLRIEPHIVFFTECNCPLKCLSVIIVEGSVNHLLHYFRSLLAFEVISDNSILFEELVKPEYSVRDGHRRERAVTVILRLSENA